MSGSRDRQAVAEQAFREFVDNPAFSCLAGKGVVNGGGYVLRSYGALGSGRSVHALARDLGEYVRSLPAEATSLTAFVAVFGHRVPANELAFEQRLWTQLQGIHALDAHPDKLAPGTSDDPADPTFAFNFNGVAMFVVGMHPHASRLARRFGWPALVFNPHQQFQRLREMNRFEKLRGIVRDREIALQGSLNPNLADFGDQSEARQYSGRHVEDEWQCPYHRTP